MEKWINDWAKDWCDAKFLYNQIDNAKAIGAVETLRKLQELTAEEVTGELSDDE